MPAYRPSYGDVTPEVAYGHGHAYGPEDEDTPVNIDVAAFDADERPVLVARMRAIYKLRAS